MKAMLGKIMCGKFLYGLSLWRLPCSLQNREAFITCYLVNHLWIGIAGIVIQIQHWVHKMFLFIIVGAGGIVFHNSKLKKVDRGHGFFE
jgi:hypothetical protein